MSKKSPHSRENLRQRRLAPRRRWRANLRDTWVLIREFREALLIFTFTIIVGAASFQALWNGSQARPMRLVEALYIALSMTFFNPPIDFPETWHLDIYFFLMPIIGLAVLARGAADFVTLLFNRSARQSQWEEAVAQTFNDHIIVCGLGHLGLRVVRELVGLDEEVVVLERQTDSPRFDEIRQYDIPVIVGDARQPETLRKAGIEKARAIIICTNDDLINLQIASRIRELDKDIRLVMRMFDDEFARNMADSFKISAVMSASMLAAPAFAGAAAGAEINQTFKVDDRVLAMGRVVVERGSKLDGSSIQAIEEKLDLSVVLLQTGDSVDVHPEEETRLAAGDVIAVVAELPAIKKLSSQWNHRR